MWEYKSARNIWKLLLRKSNKKLILTNDFKWFKNELILGARKSVRAKIFTNKACFSQLLSSFLSYCSASSIFSIFSFLFPACQLIFRVYIWFLFVRFPTVCLIKPIVFVSSKFLTVRLIPCTIRGLWAAESRKHIENEPTHH